MGYALFVRCRGGREIIEDLAERNIPISDREIVFLGKKFLIYLGVAHRESRDRIKSAMKRRGGYILHLDGTCEGDSPHLLFYHRLKAIYAAVGSVRASPLRHEPRYRPTNRLFRTLKPVMEDATLKRAVGQLDRKVDNLRRSARSPPHRTP